jgi:mRNA interferase MazF
VPAGAPQEGEVWWVDLEPVRGHEQGRKRPCLVVSVDEFNRVPHGLVWVLPITSNPRRHAFAVPVASGESGLPSDSMILCHQLRSVTIERLEERAGSVPLRVLEQARGLARAILG